MSPTRLGSIAALTLLFACGGGDAAADGDAELPRNPFAVLKALTGGGASGPDGDGAGGASGV